MDALRGARTFISAGMVCLDELFSPEQLVIDNEIIRWIERLMKGFEFNNKKGFSLQVIKEADKNTFYLDHSLTVDRFRNECWIPEIFEHSMLNQWQQAGSKSIRDKARDIARDKIKNHVYHLDKNVQSELNKIYKSATKELS